MLKQYSNNQVDNSNNNAQRFRPGSPYKKLLDFLCIKQGNKNNKLTYKSKNIKKNIHVHINFRCCIDKLMSEKTLFFSLQAQGYIFCTMFNADNSVNISNDVKSMRDLIFYWQN